MKKRIASLILAVILVVMSGGLLTAHGEEYPYGTLKQKYSNVLVPPPDTRQPITPTWNGNRCTFVDYNGVSVYSNLPRRIPMSTYGRQLIDIYHMELPENGHYYEYVYATKSTTDFKFKEYVTDAWAQATQYNVTKSHTISWSHTGQLDLSIKKMVVAHYALNYTTTTQNSIGVTIKANGERYSKLGLYVQYIHNYIEYYTTVERNGSVETLDRETGTTDNPHDYQYTVVYRN